MLSPRLAVMETGEELVFVNASGPLMSCGRSDQPTKRLLGAMLLHQGLAQVDDLAQVLDTSRSALYRNRQRYRAGGFNALRDGRGRGPRPPHKLTAAVTAVAQRHLDAGCSRSETARRVGVSPRALAHALERGQLKRPQRRQPTRALGPRPRAERDARPAPGVGTAVKRLEERRQAASGGLSEAVPQFEAVEGVAHAGVLLALPAMLGEGLLSVAEQVYAPLKQGFYGLRSTLLCLVILALLRIKSIEQLRLHAPGELGLLLGLDRVPEVKTLRRKLDELGAQKNGAKFASALAERWARDDPEELGMLYVDGHVNVYTGRKHPLPKTWVQKRRQCLPAATDTWVNNGASEPLFFVTSPINAHLLSLLEQEVIPKARAQIRPITGASRRLTLVFDREAWSPKSFQRWRDEGVDVITYRKGKQTPWPHSDYRPYTLARAGSAMTYLLAERSVMIRPGNRRQPAFWMREVRRLGHRGQQTSVLTTRQDLPAEIIADRMFTRWRQENFFKYMEAEFNLDQLCTYETEPADGTRQVPNPERRAIDKRLKATQARLGIALAELRATEKTQASADQIAAQQQTIQTLEAERDGLRAQRQALPTRVALHTLHDPERLVHHEIERKTLTRLLKTIAYRSESGLARLVEPFFARHDDEIRAFLKSVFWLTGDLIPDDERGELRVYLYPLSNHRSQRALAALCERLNEQPVLYPGTHLRMVYQVIESH
jgi:hypothetical protein